MYLLRMEADLGLKEIGAKFGVSYSTVSHQVGWVRNEKKSNERFAQKVRNCNPKT
jgi:chromosomal replication initiation ATPase DnaA